MVKQDAQIMRILRLILGIMCTMLVPLAVGLGCICFKENTAVYATWWQSVSDTWCASSNIIMIGTLFCSSVVMFAYKGYDIRDRVLSLIQGATMLGVILFPCRPAPMYTNVGIFGLPPSVCGFLHGASASLLCAAQALQILWLFRLTGGAYTKEKHIRNKIYLICGITCVAGFALLVLCFVASGLNLKQYGLIDVAEFLWLGSYGVAWITKSESIWLKDREVVTKL